MVEAIRLKSLRVMRILYQKEEGLQPLRGENSEISTEGQGDIVTHADEVLGRSDVPVDTGTVFEFFCLGHIEEASGVEFLCSDDFHIS